MTMSKLLSVFMLLDGVLSGSLNAKNSCGFPIYCMVARAASSVNPVGETSGITEVAAGGTYTSTGDFAAANVSGHSSLTIIPKILCSDALVLRNSPT